MLELVDRPVNMALLNLTQLAKTEKYMTNTKATKTYSTITPLMETKILKDLLISPVISYVTLGEKYNVNKNQIGNQYTKNIILISESNSDALRGISKAAFAKGKKEFNKFMKNRLSVPQMAKNAKKARMQRIKEEEESTESTVVLGTASKEEIAEIAELKNKDKVKLAVVKTPEVELKTETKKPNKNATKTPDDKVATPEASTESKTKH